jgi:hypothetical protein
MNRLRTLLLCTIACLAGCTSSLKFQVVLNEGESIKPGDIVFVDSVQAGQVDSVGNEAGDKVANISITANEVKDRLRVGAVRVPEPGRIQINTEAVTSNDRMLSHGARIPTKTKLVYMMEQYSRGSGLVTAVVAIVALIVVYLVFKGLMGALTTIVAIAMAALTAQVFHQKIVPWVVEVYAKLGPPPEVMPQTPSTAKTVAGKVVGDMNATIQDLMSQFPPPAIVAFAVVGFVSLVIYLIILGRLTSRMRH